MLKKSIFFFMAVILTISVCTAKEAVSFAGHQFHDAKSVLSRDHDVTIHEQGWVSYTVSFSDSGTYQFVILARRDNEKDIVPSLKISIDDEQMHLQPVTSEKWATYAFQSPVRKGKRRLIFSCPVADSDEIHLASVVIVPPKKSVGIRLLPQPRKKQVNTDPTYQFHQKLVDRIQQLRMGKLKVQVLDKKGNPVRRAEVKVQQRRHSFMFGAALSTEVFDGSIPFRARGNYKENFVRYFNCCGTGNALTWKYMEPVPGQVRYSVSDKIIDWAYGRQMPMWGADIFSACEAKSPAWIKSSSDNRLRSSVSLRARVLGGRYRRKVNIFAVNADMLSCSYFQQRLGSGIQRQMFHEMRSADPLARLYLNENINLNTDDIDSFMKPLRALLKAGLPITGIGIRGEFNGPVNAYKVERALNALLTLGIPVRITGYTCTDPNEKVRERGMESFYRVAFSHPAVEGIMLRDFWQMKPSPTALLQPDFSTTPLAELYSRLIFSEWWTVEEGRTDKNGFYEIPAFLGNYDITVSGSRRRKMTQKTVVHKNDTRPVVFTF